MFGAVFGRHAAGHPVARSLTASIVGAFLQTNIDHTVESMFCTELWLRTAGHPIPWLPAASVTCTELGRAAQHLVHRLLGCLEHETLTNSLLNKRRPSSVVNSSSIFLDLLICCTHQHQQGGAMGGAGGVRRTTITS